MLHLTSLQPDETRLLRIRPSRYFSTNFPSVLRRAFFLILDKFKLDCQPDVLALAEKWEGEKSCVCPSRPYLSQTRKPDLATPQIPFNTFPTWLRLRSLRCMGQCCRCTSVYIQMGTTELDFQGHKGSAFMGKAGDVSSSQLIRLSLSLPAPGCTVFVTRQALLSCPACWSLDSSLLSPLAMSQRKEVTQYHESTCYLPEVVVKGGRGV